jgi:hypothetical protein
MKQAIARTAIEEFRKALKQRNGLDLTFEETEQKLKEFRGELIPVIEPEEEEEVEDEEAEESENREDEDENEDEEG